MSEPVQLDVYDILGRDPDQPRRPPTTPRPLTDRQAIALDIIRRAGPDGITAQELGQRVHHARARHALERACQWCAVEGNELGAALRRRQLTYHAGHDRWTLEEHRGSAPTRPHGRAPRSPREAVEQHDRADTSPPTSSTGTTTKGAAPYDPATAPWPEGF